MNPRPALRCPSNRVKPISARLYGITQRFLYSHIGDPLKEEMEALDAIDKLIIQRRKAMTD